MCQHTALQLWVTALVQSKADRTEVLAQKFHGLQITFSLEGSYVFLAAQQGWIDALGEGGREQGVTFHCISLSTERAYGQLEPHNLELQMIKLRFAGLSTIFMH